MRYCCCTSVVGSVIDLDPERGETTTLPSSTSMTKHSEDAKEFVGLAKNGVVGQVCTRQAIEELLVLEPWLVPNMSKKTWRLW